MRKIIILLAGLIAPCMADAQSLARYSVVIDEIMSDPSPQVGLPNNEWIELKNVSSTPVNLQGLRISDVSGVSGPLPSFILYPDSFVIVCGSSAVATMSRYGRAISVTSFPSLDNDGDRISLMSAKGELIHAVEYSLAWYDNAVKQEGGWSLEMIDPNNPCTGQANWKASTHLSGGTPGQKNSMHGILSDEQPPRLIRTFNLDSITIIAVFDEPVDSTMASVITNFSFDKGLSILSASPQSPIFNKVLLTLSVPAEKETVYTLTVSNLVDCKGNVIGAYNKAKAGVSQEAVTPDLVINEILFNPRPAGYDYVELYNKSKKVLDASRIMVAGRNPAGALTVFKPVSTVPFLIFPGEYLTLTEQPVFLEKEYMVKNSFMVFPVILASYPDDKGSVVVANAQGMIVDEVTYSEKWHFALIDNPEGVALERIDPSGKSSEPSNWHSAAATVGYGTPTYQNSQFQQAQTTSEIDVYPKIFSPDNDGTDDVLTISYEVEQSGIVASISVFDAGGRFVRLLVKNDLLGYKGSWTWDGLGDKQQRLPMGQYIIHTEMFDLQGKRNVFKKAVVLARRFK